MTLSLGTVSEFISAARSLLQDTVTEYRYSDDDILQAMNIGLLSARRLRADLFLDDPTDIPAYTTNDGTAIDFDSQYLPSLLYFVVGYVNLRDQEETQDSRAVALLNKFTSQMLTIGA